MENEPYAPRDSPGSSTIAVPSGRGPVDVTVHHQVLGPAMAVVTYRRLALETLGQLHPGGGCGTQPVPPLLP